MKKFFALVWIAGLLLSASLVSAQAASAAPYLYYYSRLLGGLIIEHPDGSDSRLIGADVIPPNLTGISGPGWSPSGKYFAGYGFIYDAYSSATKGAYLLDRAGNTVSKWLADVNAGGMQWSPTGEDLLLITGVLTPNTTITRQESFWVVDASTGSVLTEDVENCGCTAYEFSPILWETAQHRIRFYTRPETDASNRAYQITMQFDGTVLKQPVTDAEFSAHYVAPDVTGDNPDPYDAHGVSPSGTYEASGKYPTILHNRLTGEEVDLPTHSQGTICRAYRWDKSENYIITLDGTLIAGGGCAPAVLGITDSHGQLWRELGGCSWDSSCVGWLPANIDLSKLPPGQPKPVQLDPVAYEPDTYLESYYGKGFPDIRLRCNQQGLLDVVEAASQTILYQLKPASTCLTNPIAPGENGVWKIAVGYDPLHKLLAVYDDFKGYTTIWSMQTTPGRPILRLNTYGYRLEFTPDGQQLRARNRSAWKIYSVADILAAAGLSQ